VSTQSSAAAPSRATLPAGSAPIDDALLRARWEQASDACAPVALFQTAAFARVASFYDVTTGRRPVVLSPEGPDSFCLPLSVAREGGVTVARILAEPIAQYADAPGAKVDPAVLHRGLNELRRSLGVDLVILRRVRDDTALSAALDGMRVERVAGSRAPYIPLDASGPLPGASGGKPKAYRDALRLKRRLEKAGGYAFAPLPAGAKAQDAIRVALQWKRSWVEERAAASRLAADAALGETIVRLFGEADISPIVGLVTHHGEPVAVEAGFVRGDRMLAYFCAYRPDRRGDGVGKIAMAEMVDWSAASGLRVYDQLPPGDDYKFDWTERSTPVADRIVAVSLPGVVRAHLVDRRFKPLAKAALGRLPAGLRRRVLKLAGYAPTASA